MVGAPTAPMQRRRPLGRAVVALGAVALLALLVLAALVAGGILGGASGDQTHPGTEAHATRELAVGAHDDAAPAIHAVHQQPSTRARSVAFAVLAGAIVIALWPAHRLRLARGARLRSLRIAGLPPGRAPPAFRIA